MFDHRGISMVASNELVQLRVIPTEPPMIKHLITKIYGYKVFAEIDLTNAFHQIRIGDETSRKFSIQTPWGQVQPEFMPEGVAPAFVNCVDRLEG